MKAVTREIVIDLHVSADEFIRHYNGAANAVVVRARSGQTVRFPANALRSFVLHDGVHGTFKLLIDENDKLMSISKLD